MKKYGTLSKYFHSQEISHIFRKWKKGNFCTTTNTLGSTNIVVQTISFGLRPNH